MKKASIIVVGFILGMALCGADGANIGTSFVQKYCVTCHSGTEPDGDIDLSGKVIDWQSPQTVSQWETVQVSQVTTL